MFLFILFWVGATTSFILGTVFAVFFMKPKRVECTKKHLEDGEIFVVDPTKFVLANQPLPNKTEEQTDTTPIRRAKKDPTIGAVKRKTQEDIEKKLHPKRTAEEEEMEKTFDTILGEEKDGE